MNIYRFVFADWKKHRKVILNYAAESINDVLQCLNMPAKLELVAITVWKKNVNRKQVEAMRSPVFVVPDLETQHIEVWTKILNSKNIIKTPVDEPVKLNTLDGLMFALNRMYGEPKYADDEIEQKPKVPVSAFSIAYRRGMTRVRCEIAFNCPVFTCPHHKPHEYKEGIGCNSFCHTVDHVCKCKEVNDA